MLTPALGEESVVEFIIRQYALIYNLAISGTKLLFSELFGYTFLLGAAVNALLLAQVFTS